MKEDGMLVVTVGGRGQKLMVMVMLMVVIKGLLNFRMQKGINFTYNQMVD